MSNPWFRLYSEFAIDPKIQRMCEFEQRRFIMLLCLRCSNGNVTLQDDDVAFQLRISNEEWAATKQVFLSKNLIDEANNPVAWDRRQFRSDSSAERVSKHRANKKQACNVTVTAPDTDTDTEKNKPSREPIGFAEFWDAYPKKVGKGAAEKAWAKCRPDLTAVLAAVGFQSASEQWRKDGGQFIPNPATWLNQRRWEDEVGTGSSGSLLVADARPDFMRGAL